MTNILVNKIYSVDKESFDLYKREAKKHPKLSKEEQTSIGESIEKYRLSIVDCVYEDSFLLNELNKYLNSRKACYLDKDFFVGWVIGNNNEKNPINCVDIKNKLYDLYEFAKEKNNVEAAKKLGSSVLKAKRLEDKLIESNLLTVINESRKYFGLIEFSELIQAGNLGLVKAVAYWRYRQGSCYGGIVKIG